MSIQTVTRTIESDLDPTPIYAILSNPLRLPEWAPVFADRIDLLQGTSFRITKGAESFTTDVIANQSSLTVDYLREMDGNKRGGAYIRVMPRPLGGSTVVMTVPVGPATTPQQVADVVDQELKTLLQIA